MSEIDLTSEQLSAAAVAYSAVATLLASGTPAYVVLDICRKNAEFMIEVVNYRANNRGNR